MLTGKIYKITNRINGKLYIGQTKGSLKDRFQRHCWNTGKEDNYHNSMAIKVAIHKYGKENFEISLIEEVPIDMLDEREKYWISYYNSYEKGYNCTLGGQNGVTRPTKLSKEQELEVIEAKGLGFSSYEISKTYNIDKTTVKNIFKRHNLKMPVKHNLEYSINYTDFVEYLKNNPTVDDIMNKFNICKSSVRNYIKRHNIEYNFSKSVQALTSKVEG